MKRWVLVVSVVVAALPFSACSSGSDGKAPAAAESSASTTARPVSDEELVQCRALFDAYSTAAAAFTAGNPSPEALAAMDALDSAATADRLPRSVSDAVGEFVSVAGGYLKALQKIGFDPTSETPPSPDQVAELEKTAKKLDVQAVTDATVTLNGYFASACPPVAPQ